MATKLRKSILFFFFVGVSLSSCRNSQSESSSDELVAVASIRSAALTYSGVYRRFVNERNFDDRFVYIVEPHFEPSWALSISRLRGDDDCKLRISFNNKTDKNYVKSGEWCRSNLNIIRKKISKLPGNVKVCLDYPAIFTELTLNGRVVSAGNAGLCSDEYKDLNKYIKRLN